MDIVRMKCAQVTSTKSLKFIAGESMPKIILNVDVAVVEIEEAISHLRRTQTNTHNLSIAKWCEQEIDMMLDEILARS